MSSEFEKFIQRNKGEFNSDIPADKVWEKIEKNIAVKKARVFTLREVYKWSAAAAILFICLTSVYFLFLGKPAAVNPVAKARQDEKRSGDNSNEISNFDPEYANEARQIFQAIAASQLELQGKAKDEPQLYKEFTADLGVLDSSYHELKSQAALSSNRDIIIQAMIDNLKLQAALLRRQLMIMNSFNNKTLGNEKSNSSSL